jgi:outer membrane murein-binding lipoprotein Lpp
MKKLPLLLVVVVGTAACGSTAQRRIDVLAGEVTALRSTVAELKSALEDTRGEVEELRDEVDELSQDMDDGDDDDGAGVPTLRRGSYHAHAGAAHTTSLGQGPKD